MVNSTYNLGINMNTLVCKPCPFCGMKVELTEPDTLHPSGLYWREVDGMKHYIRHKDRLPTDNASWVMNCVETAGGCGVEIHADSKEDAIARWNKRV
jgi:hypothetical protein